MRVRALALLLCLCTLAAPAFARPRHGRRKPRTPAEALAEAQNAYDHGYYKRALGLLKPLVDQGQAAAMVLMGRMYELGKGTPQDLAQAVHLYGRASARRDLEARYRLAMMYLNGEGVPVDEGRGLRMIQGAAQEGYPAAETQLGIIYSRGDLLPRDYGAAVTWYEKAAASGDPEAQYSLGLMYDSGIGLPQQEINAAQWFRLAAEQGFTRAQYVLGLMYTQDSHLGPRRPVEAYKWLALAAKGGLPAAGHDLGEFVVTMSTTEVQEGIAAARAEEEQIRSGGRENAAKAAAAALTPGQKALDVFSKGHYQEAYQMAQPLVLQDDADAMFLLGVMYDGGFYVKQDEKKALQYMKLAADHDYGPAEFSLGVTYEFGLAPVPAKNDSLAYFWYSLAASHGDEDATDKVTQLAKVIQQAGVDVEKQRVKDWRDDHARRKRMQGEVAGGESAAMGSAQNAALTSMGLDTATANVVPSSAATSHAFDYFGKK